MHIYPICHKVSPRVVVRRCFRGGVVVLWRCCGAVVVLVGSCSGGAGVGRTAFALYATRAFRDEGVLLL